MIILTEWLKDHVDFTYSNKELGDKLTSLGLECNVKSFSSSYNGVVVGRVISIKKIVNTDHLKECVIDIGLNILTIVCGAPNIKENILVPVAVPGATLGYGKFVIKKTKIRGVESNGMICSEKELGISENHEGIMLLDSSFSIGNHLKDVMENNHREIIEIDLTPNRGDCFSHLGISREISALSGNYIKDKKYDFNKYQEKIDNYIQVDVQDSDSCPRYCARVVKNITVKESPKWLKDRLEAIGQKSINNVVDAANYVLFDRGHPMHTFDLNKLKDSKIIVKKSDKKQNIVCLDDITREVSKDHLLICDGAGPIAIAGVIGGKKSSVDENTTDIVIESAYFDPVTIRKGSKQLDLSTDASKRFERDTDIDNLLISLDMLCSLLQDIAGGDVLSGTVDLYQKVKVKKKVNFDIDQCNKLLGTELSEKIVLDILSSLSIIIKKKDRIYECEIPHFRNDLERPVDLYEEIARVYGYDNIEATDFYISSYENIMEDTYKFQKKFAHLLSANGYIEHYSNSLISDNENSWYSKNMDVMISNPLSNEMHFLRNSIIPGLVNAVEYNINHGNLHFKIFELGPIHKKISSKGEDEYFQENHLGICWNCSNSRDWKQIEKFDIYSIKGEISYIFDSFGINIDYIFKEDSIIILASGQKIGRIVNNHEFKSKVFDKEKNIFLAEFNIDKINDIAKNDNFSKADTIASFPSIERDLAIQVSTNISYEKIKNLLERLSGDLLKSVILFDIYKGEDIPKDCHSLGLSLKFSSSNRTLKDDEIDKIMNKVVLGLKEKFNAIQR